MRKITIVSRTSSLAMWQAKYIRLQLLKHHAQLSVDILGVKTLGDRWLEVPLHKVGGKGLFVKELEEALLAKEADIAVHSLKDVPAQFPEGLDIAAICERENPFDAWVCPQGFTLENIPKGSLIGTSSLRRQVQLKRLRPDLQYGSLRGNVDSRLRKCQEGHFDAIVLAVAGLARLNLLSHAKAIFSADQLLPAVAQGALGIECREEDSEIKALLAPLNHQMTQICIKAERAMNKALGGNCQVPVAGFAQMKEGKLFLTGRVGHPESLLLLEATRSAPYEEAVSLGEQVANDLIQQGAQKIISDVLHG